MVPDIDKQGFPIKGFKINENIQYKKFKSRKSEFVEFMDNDWGEWINVDFKTESIKRNLAYPKDLTKFYNIISLQ